MRKNVRRFTVSTLLAIGLATYAQADTSPQHFKSTMTQRLALKELDERMREHQENVKKVEQEGKDLDADIAAFSSDVKCSLGMPGDHVLRYDPSDQSFFDGTAQVGS